MSGRPKTRPKTFRATPVEDAKLAADADAVGISESEYVRRALIHAARCPDFDPTVAPDAVARGRRGWRFWKGKTG